PDADYIKVALRGRTEKRLLCQLPEARQAMTRWLLQNSVAITKETKPFGGIYLTDMPSPSEDRMTLLGFTIQIKDWININMDFDKAQGSAPFLLNEENRQAMQQFMDVWVKWAGQDAKSGQDRSAVLKLVSLKELTEAFPRLANDPASKQFNGFHLDAKDWE